MRCHFSPSFPDGVDFSITIRNVAIMNVNRGVVRKIDIRQKTIGEATETHEAGKISSHLFQRYVFYYNSGFGVSLAVGAYHI